MDDNSLRNKVRATLDEFFAAGVQKGLTEAVEVFTTELTAGAGAGGARALGAVFRIMMDRKVKELGGALSALLKALHSKKYSSSADLTAVLEKEFALLCDKDMDCPGYSNFVAVLIGQAVADGLLDFPIITRAFAHEDVVEFDVPV